MPDAWANCPVASAGVAFLFADGNGSAAEDAGPAAEAGASCSIACLAAASATRAKLPRHLILRGRQSKAELPRALSCSLSFGFFAQPDREHLLVQKISCLSFRYKL